LTVQDIAILIEGLKGQGINALSLFKIGFPEASLLPFGALSEKVRPEMFLPDGEGVLQEAVRQALAKLHRL
jgi:hypothetical protein